MSEDSRKFAEKIGQVVMPGGQAYIGTQIIHGEKQLRPTKNIPRGSVHFVGRERELSLLHGDLQRGDYVALAGMGGVGKTELATQYARRYEDKYGGIVWFNARETNLPGEVLKFFSLQLGLEIPQKDKQERLLSLKEQVAWCWSNYPHSDLPILIIFDDVTDLANLREAVPTNSHFRVLVTTRLRNLDRNFIQEIPIDVLSPKKEPGKALELLQRLLGEGDKRVENQAEAAANICACLEYLPLGIDLVGGYLVKDPEISLPMMLQRLQEQKLAEAALQNRETLNSTQLGIKAAFTLTWERLNPLTQQLGNFLSLFSPQSILWELVVWVATKSQNIEQTDSDQVSQSAQAEFDCVGNLLNLSPQEFNEARKQLYERNLLQKVEETEGYYQIHSLVRWFLQSQLAESGEMQPLLERTFATAMITIARQIPPSPTSEQIEIFKDTNPHLEELGRRLIAEAKEREQGQINSLASVLEDEVAWVFVGVGRFYQGQGFYQLAEPWREECLGVCQVLFAGDHPDVATSLNNLAELYRSQGRYAEAEPLLVDALEMTKRLFAGDHPDVAGSLNNLAGLYDSQGRYAEAEPLYVEALEMRKRLFAADHPDVALSLNNLAALYDSQGRYAEAEPLLVDALEMTKRLFAGDHPNVATSLNNLAFLYRSQGRYAEAEPLYVDALEMRKRLFAGDHPNVATSLNNLALLYYSQGRYADAEPLYVDALEMCQRVLGVNHPTTVTVRENLTILQRQRTPLGILKRWLGYFVAIVLVIVILPFYLLWLLVKQILTFIFRRFG
ncbi:MAG: tetratricopeptide repeat protein [Calothrix sp. MO_192.B10]|nr:tetratricopeptide repeat protein [Calothrix sp. MO_192.B10]